MPEFDITAVETVAAFAFAKYPQAINSLILIIKLNPVL
jgi:hypothetical protein